MSKLGLINEDDLKGSQLLIEGDKAIGIVVPNRMYALLGKDYMNRLFKVENHQPVGYKIGDLVMKFYESALFPFTLESKEQEYDPQ